MPNNIIKSFAEKSGKSEAEVEKLWAKAEKIADKADTDNKYAYLVGVLKKMLDIKEEFNLKSFKTFLKEAFLGAAIIANFDDNKLKSNIKELQTSIPKDKLVVNPNAKDSAPNGLELNPHVSVLINITDDIDDNTLSIIKRIVLKYDRNKDKTINQKDNLNTIIEKIDYFDLPKFTVVMLKVKSKVLDNLHKELKDTISNKHTFEFKPHLTLAYCEPGYRLEKNINNFSIKIDKIYVSTKDFKKIKI